MTMPDLSQLAAELAIVVAFIWYLRHRDQQTKDLATNGHDAVRQLAVSFSELKEAISVQNELLRQNQSANSESCNG